LVQNFIELKTSKNNFYYKVLNKKTATSLTGVIYYFSIIYINISIRKEKRLCLILRKVLAFGTENCFDKKS